MKASALVDEAQGQVRSRGPHQELPIIFVARPPSSISPEVCVQCCQRPMEAGEGKMIPQGVGNRDIW